MTAIEHDWWSKLTDTDPTHEELVEGTRGVWQVILGIEANTEQLVEDNSQIKEDLAGHGKRLRSIDRKLREHDTRFDAVDERLAGHDARFDAVDERLAGHDARFDAVDSRLDTMDTKLDLLIELAKRPS
jgi:chromosome segregation ATPase